MGWKKIISDINSTSTNPHSRYAAALIDSHRLKYWWLSCSDLRKIKVSSSTYLKGLYISEAMHTELFFVPTHSL